MAWSMVGSRVMDFMGPTPLVPLSTLRDGMSRSDTGTSAFFSVALGRFTLKPSSFFSSFPPQPAKSREKIRAVVIEYNRIDLVFMVYTSKVGPGGGLVYDINHK